MKIMIFVSIILHLVNAFGQDTDVILKSHTEAKSYWSEGYDSKSNAFRDTQIDMHSLKELNLRAASIWDSLLNCKQGNTAQAVLAFTRQSADCPEVQKNIFELHKNIFQSLVSADLVPVLERYSEDSYLKFGYLPMHPLLVQILVNFYAALAAAERLSESIYDQTDLESLMKFDVEATLKKIADAKAEKAKRVFLEATDFANKFGPQLGQKSPSEIAEIQKSNQKDFDKKMRTHYDLRDRTKQLFEYQVNFVSNILFLIRQATVFSEACENFGLISEYSINAINQASLAHQKFEGSFIRGHIQYHIRYRCLIKFKHEVWSLKPEIVPPSLKALTYINRNYFLGPQK